MRSPNRKHKPKHMTKIKYKRVELDWILVYQKSSKRLSVKPPLESYWDYEDMLLFSWEYDKYDKYVDWYRSQCKHVKYKRYGVCHYL